MMIHELFFSLLRSALWGTTFQKGADVSAQYPVLRQLADKQAMHGLISSAVTDPQNAIKLQRNEAVLTYSDVTRATEANKKLNKAVVELCQLLQQHSIPFIVVKGQTIGSLYRNPMARTTGDIDFYCDSAHFDAAKAVIDAAWKPEYLDDDDEEEEQHITFTHFDVPFEMHFNLMKFYAPNGQKYWDDLLAHEYEKGYSVQVAECDVPTLSPEVNVLYTFLHLYHHLLELGVGVRQFCDVAVLLHHHYKKLDVDILERHLSALGCLRAFKVVGTILVDDLGLPESEFPFVLTKADRQYRSMILDVVFRGGNFGFHSRTVGVRQGMFYYVEAAINKLRNFYRFYGLSPQETKARLKIEVPRKIKSGLRRLRLKA